MFIKLTGIFQNIFLQRAGCKGKCLGFFFFNSLTTPPQLPRLPFFCNTATFHRMLSSYLNSLSLGQEPY